MKLEQQVIQLLRGLQLYDSRGAVDGAFAQDVSAVCEWARSYAAVASVRKIKRSE